MSQPKTRRFAWMRRSIWLSVVALAGSTLARAQPGASPLVRAVRPTLTDAPLTGMLAALSRQSGVPFSYSSTRIGGQRHCHLRPGPARPLGTVLHEVAGQFRLSYGLLNGQLVLWPATEPAPPGITELNSRGQAARPRPAPGRSPEMPATAAARLALPAPQARASGATLVGSAGRSSYLAGPVGEHRSTPAPRPETAAPENRPVGRLRKGGAGAASSNIISHAAALAPQGSAGPVAAAGPGTVRAGRRSSNRMPGAGGPLPAVSASAQPLSTAMPEPAGKRGGAEIWPLPPRVVAPASAIRAAGEGLVLLPTRPEPEPLLRPQLAVRRQLAQVSLLPPLSSNWLANARTVNGYSLNVLAGYSAGVSRLELGGLLNVVRDSVQGLQAAGLANLTGTDTRGVQLAGMANVNGGAVRGVQGAGMVNIARDDVRGLQVAGLANITGGAALARHRPDQPTRLRRWLGLPRLLATNSLGQLPAAPSSNQRGLLVQAAALTNLTGTDVRGLQTAALLNLAHRVSGVQFGLVNVARHVHGVQFGLINIADSVDGVSLGIVNIVRHGYLHGEVWASESLPLNAVLKLGVRRYYTLLGAAAEPFGSRVQWAGGVGIGTAGRPHGRFTFSFDALHWTLAGTSDNASNQPIDTRLLTQLRPAVAWQIERQGHLQLVVSPTLNLAIAWSNDHQPEWDFGANQLLLINTAGGQSRTRLWPGLQIGLRL